MFYVFFYILMLGFKEKGCDLLVDWNNGRNICWDEFFLWDVKVECMDIKKGFYIVYFLFEFMFLVDFFISWY